MKQKPICKNSDTFDSLIDKYEDLGYTLNFIDKSRFAELFKSFGNKDEPVGDSEQLQVGEAIEICNGEVRKKPYYKRGRHWSTSSRGIIFQMGKAKVFEKY